MKSIHITQTQSNSCCTPAPVKQVERERESHTSNKSLPVLVIGAGPIGLAAAAHLVERGEDFILLEAGKQIGQHVTEWGHVRLFSPWQYNVDKAAVKLLFARGWSAPPKEELPTGQQLVDLYLKPLSQLPAIQSRLYLNMKVVAVSKKDTDKMKSANREQLSFEVYAEEAGGNLIRYEARAVIDATGTWGHSNPLYASGVWTNEERSLSENIYYGIPDVKGAERDQVIGKRIAVVGGGHSALNTLLDLADLKASNSATEIIWIMRKNSLEEAYGGEQNDQLAARGELGNRIHQLVDAKRVEVITPFRIQSASKLNGKISLTGVRKEEALVISDLDKIIVNTGSRPDFSFLRELRLSMDQATESIDTLAPLIDPNVHSCGTVRPHGELELRHAEKGFYIVGMKSYGRAPTFLMATGYEQVRSVVAYLAGDLEAALKVELDLPETGVCSLANASIKGEESCCTATPSVADEQLTNKTNKCCS
ncbi:FAD-dependent oxidoreductase [Paenibacillus radicis (ex Gao et al. 2016)]|uniref:Flavoprotein n=1 Tax=Paenibacillus radicis (ex Gao et al. 2016) TaxID=1737354 RepID=A0A917H6P1_9BACL|nr:FAD-dependent oxidoreductase [Paenibacillus radicis (ex Gao et al. 2016)]GGG68782.1 flavoprotein [Paenibacillus radicis (ex Gao et al. 2016)]